MMLSVKPRWNAVTCRGGRVLVVTHDHQISTRSYDPRPDQVIGKPVRVFSHPWVTAKKDDLAIEIIAVKTTKLVGYGYLSGDAINLIRYVDDAERPIMDARFTPVTAHSFELLPDGPTLVKTLLAVVASGAPIAACTITLTKNDEMSSAIDAVINATHIVGHLRGPECEPCVTDIIIRVANGKQTAVLHNQTASRTQTYACHPFIVDVLLSSSCLTPLIIDPDSTPGSATCSTTSSTMS